MKKFLSNHIHAALIVLALVFLGTIIGYYTWGIGYVVTEVNEANTSQTTDGQIAGFDIQGASNLDYRGTLSQ